MRETSSFGMSSSLSESTLGIHLMYSKSASILEHSRLVNASKCNVVFMFLSLPPILPFLPDLNCIVFWVRFFKERNIFLSDFYLSFCRLLLSLFINLEEDLQADRKDFVIRTENLLVGKTSVGFIKVAGSFSALHELDVLRAIIKGKRPESHRPRFLPPVPVTDPSPYLHTWSTLNIDSSILSDSDASCLL